MRALLCRRVPCLHGCVADGAYSQRKLTLWGATVFLTELAKISPLGLRDNVGAHTKRLVPAGSHRGKRATARCCGGARRIRPGHHRSFRRELPASSRWRSPRRGRVMPSRWNTASTEARPAGDGSARAAESTMRTRACFARSCRGNQAGWSSSCRCSASPASRSRPASENWPTVPSIKWAAAQYRSETAELVSDAKRRVGGQTALGLERASFSGPARSVSAKRWSARAGWACGSTGTSRRDASSDRITRALCCLARPTGCASARTASALSSVTGACRRGRERASTVRMAASFDLGADGYARALRDEFDAFPPFVTAPTYTTLTRSSRGSTAPSASVWAGWT